MSQAEVDELVALLDLEPIEVNIFRGVSPDEDRQRVFGGQVAGQALVAAARTVDPTTVPSTRCTPTSCARATRTIPILYDVDRIRDGKSFTTRRVVAIQHGRADLQPVGVVPSPRGRSRPPVAHAGRAAGRRAAHLPRAVGAVEGRSGPVVRPAPSDRHAPRRLVAVRPQGTAAAVPTGLAARRRRAARRPAAAHVRADVRVRHDLARHHAAPPRRPGGRPSN